MAKFTIIGGGIIGTTIALELKRRGDHAVTVLEKEPQVGLHASGRNSGVIHSGINQKPGSIKARMCVEGSQLLREYCLNRGVPMNQCGTLVVARDETERATLETLKQMGTECGVLGLSLLTRQELLAREPHAKGQCALLSPNGAAVDSTRLIQTLAQDAQTAGVTYHFGEKVIDIEPGKISSTTTTIEHDHLINCAGLGADHIAHKMDIGKDFRIIPFRGEYMEVKGVDVRSMIYQAPDLRYPFLSIHLTRETDGRVLAGPSAVIAMGREAYDKQFVWEEACSMLMSRQFARMMLDPEFIQVAWKNALTSLFKSAFLKQIQSLAVGVKKEQIWPSRAGIRAQMVTAKGKMINDILVEYQTGSTHVLNAVSPGMTCSLAFAKQVVNQILG